MTSSRKGTLVIVDTRAQYEQLMCHQDSIDGCWSPARHTTLHSADQGVVQFISQTTAQKAREELLA